MNIFDCRLKTLKIETYSYYSFCIDEQWTNLMDTRLSDLDIFEISFEEQKFSDLLSYDDNEEATEVEKKQRFRNTLEFVSDPFWYMRGWTAKIDVTVASVSSSFYHSK